MNVDMKSLIGRLNKTCYEAFNNAAGLCLSRTNYDIEIEHILAKLLEDTSIDLHKIFHQYGVNVDRLTKDVETSLNRLKTGNANRPAISPRIPDLIQNAW